MLATTIESACQATGCALCGTTKCSYGLRGSSLYAQVERSLPKLLLRGEGKSPLKYIMSVLLLDFEYFIEKQFHLLTRVWVFILGGSKFLLGDQTLVTKSAKKCCHVGSL